MRKIQKVGALVMCTILLFGILTACRPNNTPPGGDSSPSDITGTTVSMIEQSTTAKPEEPVKVSWHTYTNTEQPDSAIVMEEVERLVKEKLNIDLDIHLYIRSEYPERVHPMLNTNQPIDIVSTGRSTVFNMINAAKGYFLPLDDLLKEYAPRTFNAIPLDMWKAATLKGKIYAVIPYKDLGTLKGIHHDGDLMDELGVKFPESFSAFSDLEPLLNEVKEKLIAKDERYKNWPLLDERCTNPNEEYFIDCIFPYIAHNVDGYEEFGCAGKGDSSTVFNYVETEEFAEYCKLYSRLVDKGIVPMDSKNFDSKQPGFKWTFSLSEGSLEGNKDRFGPGARILFHDFPFSYTSYVLTLTTSIGKNCAHPEAAMKVIEAINFDSDVANTLRYGIKGHHWNLNDENKADFTGTPNEDLKKRAYYQFYGVQFGGMSAINVPAQRSATLVSDLGKLNERCIVSPNLGFVFDTTTMQTEIAACQQAVSQYADNLTTGMIPLDQVDKTIEEYAKALKAAGVDDILYEVQKQLDNWRKENK